MEYEDNLIDFIDHYRGILDSKQNGEDGMAKEFMTLKTQAGKWKQEHRSSAGEKACNIKKNRYKDILPFDSTRFVLKATESGPEGNDYVNASFIGGSKEKHAYIAAQGPLQSTVTDFWRLLWESGANIIIMACNEYEINHKTKQRQLKCQRYWCEEEEEKEFGDITVSLIDSEIPHRDYKHRHLKAKKGKEEKTFHQFHYTAWPDHGVPDTVTSILDLVQRVRKMQPSEKKPLIVHCSAGCGRTGTILALDYVSELIKVKNIQKDFSLFNIIMTMRRQRPAIVQTKEQYEFVHKAVSELFKHELTSLGVDYGHNYENIQIGVLPTAQEKPRLPPGHQLPKPQKPANDKPTPGKPAPLHATPTRPPPTGRPQTPVDRPPTPVKPEAFVYANTGDVVQPPKSLKSMAIKPRKSSSQDIKEMEDIEQTLAQGNVKKPELPKAPLKSSKSPLVRVPSGRGSGSGVPPAPSKPSPPTQRKPLWPTGAESQSVASIKDALTSSHVGSSRSPGVGGSRPLFEPPKPPGKPAPKGKPTAMELGKPGVKNDLAYEPVNIAPTKGRPQVAQPLLRPTRSPSLNGESRKAGREKAGSNVAVIRQLRVDSEYETLETVQQKRISDPVVGFKPRPPTESKAAPASTTPRSGSAYEPVEAGSRHSTGHVMTPTTQQSPVIKKKTSLPSRVGSEESIPIPPRTVDSYMLLGALAPDSGIPAPRPAASHSNAINKVVSGWRGKTPRSSSGDEDGANIPVIPERTPASYELVELQPPPEDDSPDKSGSSSRGNSGGTLAKLKNRMRPQLPNLGRIGGGSNSSPAPKPLPVHTSHNGQRTDSPMANGQQRLPLAFPARLPRPNGPRPQPDGMRTAKLGVIPS